MTTARWRLTPVQLDLLWEQLGLGDYPYPFQVASFGESDVERTHLRNRVHDELAAARLLRAGRLDQDLEWALRLLAGHDHSVDSVWLADGDSPHRALAARDRNRAVLAVQQPGPAEHEGGDLTLHEVPADALVPPVIGTLPGQPPGTRPGGTLPVPGSGAPEAPAGGLLRAAAYGPGREQRQLDELLTAEHAAVGQLGVTVRDPAGRRRHRTAVTWFDNADDGRYLVVTAPGADGRQWTTVTPADANALRARVQDTERQALAHR